MSSILITPFTCLSDRSRKSLLGVLVFVMTCWVFHDEDGTTFATSQTFEERYSLLVIVSTTEVLVPRRQWQVQLLYLHDFGRRERYIESQFCLKNVYIDYKLQFYHRSYWTFRNTLYTVSTQRRHVFLYDLSRPSTVYLTYGGKKS